jgi:hypothetical protein
MQKNRSESRCRQSRALRSCKCSAYPGHRCDFVTVFDCSHDMGDPVGASSHVRKSLKPNSTWMVVEPFTNDRLEQNLNPVGRIFYSGLTMIWTPASRAQEGAMCLGAQAGETRIDDVVKRGGFTHFRRAAETEFNLIYERPSQFFIFDGEQSQGVHRLTLVRAEPPRLQSSLISSLGSVDAPSRDGVFRVGRIL